MSNQLPFIVSETVNTDGYFQVQIRPSLLRSIANRLKSTSDRCRPHKALRKMGHVLEERAIATYEKTNN